MKILAKETEACVNVQSFRAKVLWDLLDGREGSRNLLPTTLVPILEQMLIYTPLFSKR